MRNLSLIFFSLSGEVDRVIELIFVLLEFPINAIFVSFCVQTILISLTYDD